MKKIQLLLIAAVAVVAIVLVSMSPLVKVVEPTTFSVDIRCQNCVDRITANLPKICPGIDMIEADIENHKVTVYYAIAEQTPESLIKGFEQLHFKASVDGEVEVSGESCGNCGHGDGDCEHGKPAAPVLDSLPNHGRPYCKIPPTPRPAK